ncbi:ABC transporter permease [Skermanella stibiiresistens SB22]|uniref:TRAP transporter large permease protein n=1 Tax=Skermanella stibiiresistens SB22 TaxID=1385369 RepID=W9H4B7_9PROT|nr:TRAP transporter large permease [Skermanella stibiiresistens]EWY41065.1 ABC transporter permease [Skermanella stibiiresistens SB22]
MPLALALASGVALLILSAPIAIALMATTIVFLLLDPQVPMTVVGQKIFAAMDSFPLMAVPFFILVGQVMNSGGITDRIFVFASNLVGHVRGGLGHVNILSSVLMSGMSGSAVADAAGLGQVEIKAMVKQGYDREFSAAVTAASATIGPIIPPSIPLVIYGSIAGVSVSQLLLAGLIPGLLVAVGLIVVTYILSKRRNYPVSRRASLAEIRTSFVTAFPALMTPVVLVAGILSGIFTPTEASAVAALYSIAIAMLVYREVGVAELGRILVETAQITGTIFFIIGAAAVLSWIFTWLNIPQQLAGFISGSIEQQWILLILINLFLLLLGCILEVNAALILATPLLMPMIQTAGIHPVHFGIILVVNLMIGLITPPVGLNMYIVSAIARISIPQFLRGIAPFAAVLLVVLALLTFWPALSLWLPQLVFE